MSHQLRPAAWRNVDGTPSRPFRVTGTVDGWPAPQLVHPKSGPLALPESPPVIAVKGHGPEAPSDGTPRPGSR